MKKSHSTDPSTLFYYLQSIPSMIKKSVIIKNSGKYIYSTKLWSLKSKIILYKINNFIKTSHNFKMLKSNGHSYGLKSQKRKSEELLIWLKRLINAHSKNVEELMDLMCHWTFIWKSNTIAEPRQKDKL